MNDTDQLTNVPSAPNTTGLPGSSNADSDELLDPDADDDGDGINLPQDNNNDNVGPI